MSGKLLGLTLSMVLSSSALATDLSLEPCINGDVSERGSFPSQVMEDQVHAYLKWRSDQPYYLFTVASEFIETPLDESTKVVDIQ
jgi:hypothetical protein